jgi:hypothetical protein
MEMRGRIRILIEDLRVRKLLASEFTNDSTVLNPVRVPEVTAKIDVDPVDG